MLLGEFTTKIGEKKRVAIPKRLREQFRDGLILTRGYEQSLVLVDMERWEKIAKDVSDGSFISKDIRDTTRFLVGGAVEVEPDGQGRIVIPDNLYKYASLEEEVVFVGLLNWVEIWGAKLWDERLKYLNDNSGEIAEKLVTSTKL